MSVAGDRLEALLDAAVDAIILIDAQGRIARFNPAAEALFGYVADDVIGRNVSVLMPQPYRAEHDSYLDRYHHTHEPRIIGIGREVSAQRKDGSVFPIDLSVGEFLHGDEHGFVGIIRDISARKAQERRLQENAADMQRMFAEAEDLHARLTHAGRLGSLGEMVSGIAHEVNQPLTAIASYASASRRLLLSGNASREEVAGILDKIATQAERAGQVIRGLRNLARRQDAVRQALDINALVSEVARLVGFEFRNSGWRLELQLAESLPAVIGDPVQIQQVVLNLLRNAAEAMACGAHDDDVIVTTLQEGDQIVIRVDDCGPGMNVDEALRLFEPFYTTKPQGLGLGLSICKSIALAHGGDLGYRPRDVGGASFHLRLPISDT